MKVKVDSTTNISKLKVQNKTPQVTKTSPEKDVVDTDEEEQLLQEDEDNAISLALPKLSAVVAEDNDDDEEAEEENDGVGETYTLDILPQLNVTSPSTTLTSTTSRNNNLIVSDVRLKDFNSNRISSVSFFAFNDINSKNLNGVSIIKVNILLKIFLLAFSQRFKA
ncbi:uncharacterized protein LOC106096236 isoform X1 [Stomoxys calcitrans]|uniref:uncharacterized protein LOC106096236 isoform X1 n=1 Tax=Stomoxys calcitrans TaxID=35570 RepID=UPI0027E2B42F|nr:uncharacterized protein LOC106096236 isoform X1 [Stomoxys calcitrans]